MNGAIGSMGLELVCLLVFLRSVSEENIVLLLEILRQKPSWYLEALKKSRIKNSSPIYAN